MKKGISKNSICWELAINIWRPNRNTTTAEISPIVSWCILSFSHVFINYLSKLINHFIKILNRSAHEIDVVINLVIKILGMDYLLLLNWQKNFKHFFLLTVLFIFWFDLTVHIYFSIIECSSTITLILSTIFLSLFS